MHSPKTNDTVERAQSSASARMIDACRQIMHPPQLVVIGASTGGPTALIALLSALEPSRLGLPICVTLHMPPELMPVIAAHVASLCKVHVQVVTRQRLLVAGSVCFAPGDRHLTFVRSDERVYVGPMPKGSFGQKLPVDVMFASASASYGGRTLGIVLSGMGKDGAAGAEAIVAAGGTVLVQDKMTSAVWGMPGAVVERQLASAALEPAQLAGEIIRRAAASGIAA